MSNVDKLSRDGEAPVRLCNYVDVYKNEAITGDLDFMPATATPAQVANFRLAVGDTVFTKDSETANDIGVPAYVAESSDDLICGYHLAIATPDRNNIDPRFLFWAMSSARVRDQWTVLAAGVTRVGLRSDDLGKAAIPVPPLDEQRRIADFLDTETSILDRLRSLRERQRRSLADELAAKYEARLVTPFADNRVPLMHLTDPRRPIQYGIVLPGPDWPGGVPIIKGGDVAGRRLAVDQLNRTDPQIERHFVRSRVRGGDYVIAIRGSVGEIARVPAALSGANLTQDSARIAPFGCDATWLGAAMLTPDVQSQLRQQTTGATIKGINISELRRLSIPTPPSDEQTELGRWAREEAERVDSARSAIASSMLLLEERRQALITAAVAGQIDVTTAGGGAQ